jgi:hypothetical protein
MLEGPEEPSSRGPSKKADGCDVKCNEKIRSNDETG